MSTDPKTIYELFRETLGKITASTSAWVDFLKVAARLYKYPFQDQVLIYAQRPEATACATYDLWLERLRRYVVNGSKGIALIDDTAPALKLKYVFDVADTRPMQKGVPAPQLWVAEHKHKYWLINSLSTTFGLNLHDYNAVDELLTAIIPNLVKDSMEQALAEFIANSANSLWDELDEHSVHTFYRDTVTASATWSIMQRCGLDPAEHIELRDFCHVLDCNTVGTITCMGVTINNVVGKVLRQVERTVKEFGLNEYKVEQIITKERRKNSKSKERRIDDGINIQDGGQLSISEIDHTGEPSGVWEVRPAAAGLSSQGATRDIYGTGNPGQTHGGSDGGRQDGKRTGGVDCGLNDGSGRNNRGAEGRQLFGVGEANKLTDKQSRGVGATGYHLHLKGDVKAADNLPAAVSISEKLPQNFHITDMHLGEGGPKTKFNANITAIKTLQRIETEARPATPEEQDILSRYVGWGGIPDAFDPEKDKWCAEYTELKSLLTEEEYKAARASVLNAHYTSPTVIKAIYQCLGNMGCKSCNILEPAMGVGNFFGLLPESMAASRLFGVELDSITGRIAKCLYPRADISVRGFETTTWEHDSFDIAVGNVPFGAYSVSDRRYDRFGFHIHDYFFAKSVDLVRPGGVVAFVTSRYTMDKKNNAVRKYLAQRCELLGAIRLPCNAFLANAGTEVTADILFLQKREHPLEVEEDWVHVGQTPDGLVVNQYFVDHPGMVLGELVHETRLYGNENLVCKPFPDTELVDLLADAIKNISGEILPYERTVERGAVSETIEADPDVRNFSFTEVKGDLYFRVNASMTLVKTSKTGAERIRGMMAIRDAVRGLIDDQMTGCDDNVLHARQSELNSRYDDFTHRYGLLNSRGNKLVFSDDASYPLLCALEVLDNEGNLKRKADMFTRRTIRQEVTVTHVDTASEALAISIGERACVDLGFMSSLLGRPGEVERIIADLQGVIFRQPDAGEDPMVGWQTADEYLSGNVRQKLRTALEYEAREPGRYVSNIEALKAAQPKDLEAHEIGVRLGAAWIPVEDYRRFIFELVDTPLYYQNQIKVTYAAVNCTWNVSGKSADSVNNMKARTIYGTKRISAYEIIEASLNLRDVQIFDLIDEKRVLNRKETILAQQKQEAIRQAFKDWLWRDPERRTRLVAYYNEHFNDTRPREFDGSHIKFVGMNPEIGLRKHQINAVARILYGGNTLLAHVVGAGKTWEMAAAAMEGKRLGLCQKSLFVVPSHLTEQWGSEFLQLYPAANILVARHQDFETANRKKFCARIATGDFDAVIIGHSQFEKIPISRKRQEAQLEQQISDIGYGIAEAKAERQERYTIKQMEYTRKSLEERLKKLTATENKDDVVTFEELGIDRLFIDEAHHYKNLFLYTKMRIVAGIGQTEAAKSSDLYMKCLYMDSITAPHPCAPGRGVIFATGTPISNSMTELYTMMRYLQNSLLEQKQWKFFDAWAAQFGETVTAIELSPEGTGYRQKTRFARFYNLPELIHYWKEVTDVQTADMLKLPVPQARYHNVVVQPTMLQREMVRMLGKRAEAVRRGEVEPNVDNMLKITNDGRNLALDQRQINSRYLDEAGSKVNSCLSNIMQIWTSTRESQSAQMIFCDLSTPKGRVKDIKLLAGEGEAVDAPFSVYYDLRKKLIDHGVPPQEIAFIHDAHTDAQKAALFAKVRCGEVRILFGSTAKMGAGTNAQTKLIALHHLDVPWRPSDIEQREGRILRQGNQNKGVDIFRYVTEGTFDAYSWQLIETKQKFIGQIMTSKSPARSCEDVDTTALSYAEVKALAAGNPKIKERMDLEVEVSKLTLLRANFQNEHYRLEDQLLTYFPKQIAQTEQRIVTEIEDIKTAEKNTLPSDTFLMEVKGKIYEKKETAGEALIAATKAISGPAPIAVGSYRGFRLEILLNAWTNEFQVRLVGAAPHSTSMSVDPVGNITRINNVLERLPETLKTSRQELEVLRQQEADTRSELTKSWPQEEEWKKKSHRLDQLNIELNLELLEDDRSISGDTGHTQEAAAGQEQDYDWGEEEL